MKNEQQLKKKHNFIKTIHRILESLKMIAGIRVKKLSKININAKKNYQHVRDNIVLSKLKHGAEKKLNILISANKGLCGSFIVSLNVLLKKNYKIDDLNECDWILIGGKLPAYTSKINKSNVLLETSNEHDPANILKISQIILEGYSNYKDINIISWNNESIKPEIFSMHDLFDCALDENSMEQNAETIERNDTMLISCVMNFLITDSSLKEEKIRLMSLDQAITNAETLLHKLNNEFNQARQAKITNEINEIINGAEHA